MSDATPSIVALVPDVFFSVTVRNVIRASGAQAVLLRSIVDLPERAQITRPVLVIVDLTALGDDAAWDTLAQTLASDNAPPSLGFGPHREATMLRRGRQIGMTKVVPNSQFHGQMPDLIAATRADRDATTRENAANDDAEPVVSEDTGP